MQKNSIREMSQNDTSQVVGGFSLGKIDNLFLISAGVGAVGGAMVTGVVTWIMYRVMAKHNAKLEEQVIKGQDITKAFCEGAQKIHEQCLVLAHNKIKNNPKDEL